MSETNGTTAAPKSATPCPVTWCIVTACTGDHFANPGGDAWPAVAATGDPEQKVPLLAPAPTWGEVDGLDPAVVLWIDGGDREYDISIDLRPDEARRLAEQLIRASVYATHTVAGSGV